MGYRMILKEREVKISVPLEKLGEIFPKHKTESYQWKMNKKKGELMIAALTEQGWIALWCRHDTGQNVEIFSLNASRSFYSRHGRWFVDKLIELAESYNGNLLLSIREPDSGGGSLTIIGQGEMVHGVFSHKLGSPQGFKSIWKSDYKPELDIEKKPVFKEGVNVFTYPSARKEA